MICSFYKIHNTFTVLSIHVFFAKNYWKYLRSISKAFTLCNTYIPCTGLCFDTLGLKNWISTDVGHVELISEWKFDYTYCLWIVASLFFLHFNSNSNYKSLYVFFPMPKINKFQHETIPNRVWSIFCVMNKLIVFRSTMFCRKINCYLNSAIVFILTIFRCINNVNSGVASFGGRGGSFHCENPPCYTVPKEPVR